MFDTWQPDEIARVERTILWIQDAVGQHFPWCDALKPNIGHRFPCTCGMDAMRANRVLLLNLRAYGTVE